MTLSMHSQLVTLLQAMESLLGDVSDGFSGDGVLWYDFISELVASINGNVLIDTGGVIWVSAVSFLFGATLNDAINSSVRMVRGITSSIYWIFEVLLARNVAAKYALGCCNWSLSLSIAEISKYLYISGPKRWARVLTLDIIWSGLWITLKWYPSSSCNQKNHVNSTIIFKYLFNIRAVT